MSSFGRVGLGVRLLGDAAARTRSSPRLMSSGDVKGTMNRWVMHVTGHESRPVTATGVPLPPRIRRRRGIEARSLALEGLEKAKMASRLRTQYASGGIPLACQAPGSGCRLPDKRRLRRLRRSSGDSACLLSGPASAAEKNGLARLGLQIYCKIA